MECYETLANAVILQAVKDYRMAYRKHRKNPAEKAALYEMESLERFFASEWFNMLTDADGRIILKKIREAEERRHRT